MTPQAVSNQPQQLVDRRMLAARRRGNNVFYRIVDPCVTSGPARLPRRSVVSSLQCSRATFRRVPLMALAGRPLHRYAHPVPANLPLVACALDTANQQKRLADWAELLGQARAREETPDGVRYTFAADDVLRTQVEALAAAEESCCSFLEFEIGDKVGASADARPRMVGKTSIETPFMGRYGDYEVVGGMRVPTTAEVAWELEDGPFTYFRGRLVDLELE